MDVSGSLSGSLAVDVKVIVSPVLGLAGLLKKDAIGDRLTTVTSTLSKSCSKPSLIRTLTVCVPTVLNAFCTWNTSVASS